MIHYFGNNESNLIEISISDPSVKSSIAYTIQSISVQSPATMKKFASVLLPLIFFAMHEEKTPDNMAILHIWEELWSENTPGTEAGLKQYLHNHINTIKHALNTSYWTSKAQVQFLNIISYAFVQLLNSSLEV